jgi:hypothetical protein
LLKTNFASLPTKSAENFALYEMDAGLFYVRNSAFTRSRYHGPPIRCMLLFLGTCLLSSCHLDFAQEPYNQSPGAGLRGSAVMVLFLFVVMMLDIQPGRCAQGAGSPFFLGWQGWRHHRLGMSYVLIGGFANQLRAPQVLQEGTLQPRFRLHQRQQVLYSQYVYPLEITAVILLVAIIAAITDARERKGFPKHQSGRWVSWQAKETVTR